MPGQCFAGYEKFDLLWQGKKIAGAAQRRNKLGLLILGSIQPPPVSLRREQFEAAMCRAAQNFHRVDWTEFSPGEILSRRAENLAGEKFSQAPYNERR